MSEKSDAQTAIDEALRRASLPADGDAEAGVILMPADNPAPAAGFDGDDGD